MPASEVTISQNVTYPFRVLSDIVLQELRTLFREGSQRDLTLRWTILVRRDLVKR